MSTLSGGRPLLDRPAAELATVVDLDAELARLRSRGVHQRPGGWVVARPDDVAAALTSAAVSVAPPLPAEPVGAAHALQTRMARFSDPPLHTRRRALLERLLPDPVGLATAARLRTTSLAADRAGTWDVMPMASLVPVLALAGAVGVPAAQTPRVADLVGRLCDALAPRLDEPAGRPDGDQAAEALAALLAPVGPWDAEQVDAVIGLLFQARDATAALIGTALLAAGHDTDPDPARSVERALRQSAPVQCTRRTALDHLRLGDATLPRGVSAWVVFAAAERGAPSQPATFGAGPHACPGAEHAVALARGVLDGLHAAGWHPVPAQPVSYQRRPNLRMPTAVLVARS